MFDIVAVVIFVIVLLALYMISPLLSPRPVKVDGAHVLITGGSSGIGRAAAVELAKRGANVSLLARNQARLVEAKTLVEKNLKNPNTQQVVCISLDLTRDYAAVDKALKQAEEKLGPIAMLFNAAGWSTNGKFEDIPVEDFKKLMDVNYFGAVNATRAVIKGMKEREEGRIVFFSSQAGQLGLYGYSGYSASKFALRGMAETLQMEVKPYNIRVTLAFPPDTDTPGFAEENATKIKETRLISETAGLFQAEYVANVVINDAVAGKFQSYMGIDGWMLSILTCGMSPATAITDVLQQLACMALFRIVSLGYLQYFDVIIRRCKLEREQQASHKKD